MALRHFAVAIVARVYCRNFNCILQPSLLDSASPSLAQSCLRPASSSPRPHAALAPAFWEVEGSGAQRWRSVHLGSQRIARAQIKVVINGANEIRRKYDLSSLQSVLSGGAPLSKEVIEGFVDKYPGVKILQGYGLTESAGIGASTDSLEESRRYGTAGLLSPSMEARIVEADSGRALAVNAAEEDAIERNGAAHQARADSSHQELREEGFSAEGPRA